MSPELRAELQVLTAAHTLLLEEHDRLAHQQHAPTVLAAHADRIRAHRTRLQSFTRRLHAEHQNREQFFTEAAAARLPAKQLERLLRVDRLRRHPA